jgi:DNA primase
VFNKSRNLFALNYARKAKNPELIVVEGYMDALALFQAGFENVAATLGTAMNREHCRIINQYFRGKTVILLFDSDSAGEAAALSVLPIMAQQNIPVRVLRIRGAKDPDEFLVKYGPEAFAKELANAKSPTQFKLDLARVKYPNLDNEALVAYLNEAAHVIAAVDDPIERDVYITALSQETGVSAEAIRGRAESKTAAPPDFEHSEYRNKPQNIKGVPEGVLSASRNVLYWMASHINFYEAIRDNLSADEFPLPVYQALAREIIKIRDAGKPAGPGELAGKFEDLTDQQYVSLVFASVFPYNNDGEIKNALNQQIKIIKTNYINRMIEESKTNNNYELLQKWGETQRNLPNSYI